MSHLERELELNGLEAPDEMKLNTVTQQTTQQNSEKPKPTCHHCKSQVTIETSAVNSNEKKTKPEITWVVLIITMLVVTRTLTRTTRNFLTIPAQTIRIIKKTEDLDLCTQPLRPVIELTTPQRNVTLEQMQQTDRHPGIDDRKDKTNSNRELLKATQMGMSKLQPKF